MSLTTSQYFIRELMEFGALTVYTATNTLKAVSHWSMVRFFHLGLTCSKQRLGLSLSFATDKRYFVSSGDTVRRDMKSIYSFAQILALRRSETLDSRSKVTLEKNSSGFSSVDNFSLPSETDFVMSSISVRVSFSTTCDVLADVELASSWNWDAFTKPADCKAPEMALAMTSLSSDGLNCKAVGGEDFDLDSVRRCFAASAIAGVLEAWRLDNPLGGMFMKICSDINKMWFQQLRKN